MEEGRLIYNLCVNEKLNGNIRSRKILAQRELTISNFMYAIYLPSLEKCINYVHYIQILSKNHCGIFLQNTCFSKPGNIWSIRDYAERMSTNFNIEI